MPDLIRHPVVFWIPAFAGMTDLGYLIKEFLAALLRGEDKEEVGLEGETTCPLPL